MRIVLLGPPGAGKGTQAARLSERFDVADIATGDLLRRNVADGSELGRQAERHINAGDLVPDDLVIAMVLHRLCEPDCDRGWLIDGFPRTVVQADALSEHLRERGQTLTAALHFVVTEDELFRRLAGRARGDDATATVRHRIEVFEKSTRPLLDYYAAQGLLAPFDAIGSLEEVSARITDALKPLLAQATR